MKAIPTRFILITAALVGGMCAAHGENMTFANGDLILGVQATGGPGADKNVFFILGSGVSYRNNGSQGLKGNIGTTLSAVYGPDWYSRTDLYFGVIGNLNQNPTSGVGSRSPVEGDPSRTVYISMAAASPGASLLVPAGTYPSAALGTAGGSVASLESIFTGADGGGIPGGFIAESDGAGIVDQTNPSHAVAWPNSWSAYNPTPGAAFNTFTGGIQQNFGKGGSATYVDVQRVLATNTGANPAGIVGGGTYETTIAIGSDGSITSLSSSGGSSPYDTWALAYPALDTPAKRLPAADPDGDGATNLAEFAFGGNPTSGSSQGIRQIRTVDANSDNALDLTLTLEVRAGANFTTSGNDMTATREGVNYRIEGSIDLLTFENPVSEVIPHLGTGSPAAGYEFKSFRLNASSGLAGKGFLRAVASDGATP